ncbi:MAG: DUF2851 family protein [Dehalococcoidales bacterium]|jgi:hypothetical protein
MPAALLEKQVLETWQNSLQGRRDLVTAANESIEVVYPGRPNDDRGADFRDAVVATARGLLRGDIEIHVKSSSWWAHRHHLDPAYNRVILHVVYQDDAAKSVVLANGCSVPTLALDRYCRTAEAKSLTLTRPPPLPCRHRPHKMTPQAISEELEAAGLERFEAKAARFRDALTRCGASQALYAGVMTALGYSKNATAMSELAAKMPLNQLAAAATPEMPDDACLAQYQSLLLGAAGLLPSQRGPAFLSRCPPDTWIATLENAWSKAGEKPALAAGDWHFFKVRPGNYPVRRLAAMSYLLLRYRREGLPAGLQQVFGEVKEDNAACLMEPSLLVPAVDFWNEYLDFDLPARSITPALLGTERAAEIAVNVLLPFAAADGFADARPGLRAKAEAIYRAYRAPPENTLVKHMNRQLGIGRGLSRTACRQQGLLHIYKTRCSQGRCRECPFSGLE